jgi:hypothetical protein
LKISKKQMGGLIGQDEAMEIIGWPVAPDYEIKHGIIYPKGGHRSRRPSLMDPDLFLSFARLAAHGDPSEGRILKWVRKYGLLRKANSESILWELEDDVEWEVERPGGRQVLLLKAHQVNQAPMSVKEFREETRHAYMCLRLLENIRSGDTDSLRSRISLKRLDPQGKPGQGSTKHVILGGHHIPLTFSAEEELTDKRVLFAAEQGLRCIVEAQLQHVRLRFAADYQAASHRTRLGPDCPDLYSALYYQLARLMVDERPWTYCANCGHPMILTRPNRKTCGGACRQAKRRRNKATRESSK